MIVDWSFIVTVGLVFFATLVGAWLRSRKRDECLAAFEGFHVTMEMDDGRLIWGVLDVLPTGLELRYRQAVQDDDHVESSYVLYANEYEKIQAIYRYADELSEENRQRRAKACEDAFHPGPVRRLVRDTRNFISTAADSFNEVFGLLIGRAKKPAGRYISDTGETYLKRVGKDVIGSVGANYDPLLERFIGRRVVVEMAEHGEVHEHVGVLKNYSPDFLEILDVQFPLKHSLTIGQEGVRAADVLSAGIDNGQMVVENLGEQPILLHTLRTVWPEEERAQAEGAKGKDGDAAILEPEEEDHEVFLNIVLDGGISIQLPAPPPEARAELQFRQIRELDMIVPRTRCVVRHRAEHYTANSLTDIVFDMGVLLAVTERDRIREHRLRRKLELHPGDPIAAAALGSLLLQQQRFEEAESLLRQAARLSASLPDNGRRVRMQLRELERRRSKGMPLAVTGVPSSVAKHTVDVQQ
ncbi:MAG: hypothetical protein D6775_10585 [Caldilineae bacterium]|nr:MAG: hypothetical protein D6775_10585 [Caldilineae bacterium]